MWRRTPAFTKVKRGANNRTARREAREFLQNRLALGPVKQGDLIEEAKQEDIAEKTLRRAKKDLGIRSRKEPGKMGGEGFWEMPPEQTMKD
jgi:hypothetical protein